MKTFCSLQGKICFRFVCHFLNTMTYEHRYIWDPVEERHEC